MVDLDDHRNLVQRLNLCHFNDGSPGMVHWHPPGYVLYRLLEGAARARIEADHYMEVLTPQLLRRPIWDASGHWSTFAGGMFRLHDTGVEAALKPVSCPGHIQIARRMINSYRDLPLRLAVFGIVHRDEPSGTLHGLLRLRQFTQDDGHVFCREDQLEEELDRFCRSVGLFYAAFGISSMAVALSTRPSERAGEESDWDRSEGALRATLARLNMPYSVQEGAGAFYGPKIEFSIPDRVGRSWQCGTIQLDLVMPRRFGLQYQKADRSRGAVMMLHRALYGSLERFMGLVLEQHQGMLPPWLAPEQLRLLPVSPEQDDYASRALRTFTAAGLRAHVDARRESLARRLVDARASGVAVIGIVGEKERASSSISVKRLDGQRVLPLPAAVDELHQLCAFPSAVMGSTGDLDG